MRLEPVILVDPPPRRRHPSFVAVGGSRSRRPLHAAMWSVARAVVVGSFMPLYGGRWL
jgi:hypothetical protein